MVKKYGKLKIKIMITKFDTYINEGTDHKGFFKNMKRIFTLPHVKKEMLRYVEGFKGESRETKKAFMILGRYMKREDISDEEKNFFKVQILDLLKGIGVIVPIQFIPIPFVSTMLLIIMDYSLKSMGIKILPSSFYKNEDEVNDRQV